MSLRPPSTSPSPSPAPNGNPKASRASMGPSGHRPAPINLNPPASPRPGSGRPTSELLGNSGMFQTPEAEAIDQWFENLQNYEATLEEMAAASLDVNFKEELSAIEQWFRVLSEAERTAALYSLLQHSTQVQIRFFITVLQQMARADPMTALLSPNAGGSMQSQMEAKLAQMGLKSPGLKSTMPSSPSARNFSGNLSANRQSLAVEPSSNSFLSPDSAANSGGGNSDAAATLAQQRAKLKANAQHRISAPALAGAAGNNVWGGSGASSLGQVAERMTTEDGAQEITIPASTSTTLNSARPKSTDFSGLLRSPRLNKENADGESSGIEAQLSPMVGGNWASMVNTPHDLMFKVDNQNNNNQNLDAAAAKLASWQMGNSGGRFSLDDAKKFRRPSKGAGNENGIGASASGVGNAIYGDDGNVISSGPQRNGRPQGWVGNSSLRSPALSNVSSGRFGGSDDGGMGGMGMNNAFGLGIPSPGLPNMGGLGNMNMATMQQLMAAAQMGQLSPLQMQQLNMNMNMMGLNMGMPDVQMQALLQAQMAAGGFMQPGLGFNAQAALLNNMNGRANVRGSSRSVASGTRSNNGRGDGLGGGSKGGGDKDGDDVDPALLNDVPAWLRSLRLHKYTPNFEGCTWREMVMMDEGALEARGVAALGARRKMLKTFEVVRHKMGVELPNANKQSSGEGDASAKERGGEGKGEEKEKENKAPGAVEA